MGSQFRVIFAFIVMLYACNFGTREPKIISLKENLIKYFKNSADNNKNLDSLNLVDLIPFRNWNKMVVIIPYSSNKSLDKLDIINIDQMKRIFSSNLLRDDLCVILYLEDKSITAYSIVDRLPLDFVSLNRNPNQAMPILIPKTELCNVLIRTSVYGEKKLFLK